MAEEEKKQDTPAEEAAPDVKIKDPVIEVIQETDLEKAKELENKTDEELEAAQEQLTKALTAIPEAAGGLLASSRVALAADLNLVQKEIKSRADQVVDTVQDVIKEAGENVDGFWDKYGSKINEGAKWAVLAAIVYRLFIF